MHTVGYYAGAQRDLKGELNILLSITDEALLEPLESLREHPVVIDIKKFRQKRSIDANNYFWKLLDEMGKTIGVDKDTMYLFQLRKWGVFTDLVVPRESIEILQRYFRFVEIFNDCYEAGSNVTVRCYFGSSHYNTKEMSDLINGTVQDAQDLGVETMTPEEIKHLLSLWKGGSDDTDTSG